MGNRDLGEWMGCEGTRGQQMNGEHGNKKPVFGWEVLDLGMQQCGKHHSRLLAFYYNDNIFLDSKSFPP